MRTNLRGTLLRRAPDLVAITALAIVIARAATLSITYDEAWTYQDFVAKGWAAAFRYDQNNHLLNSLLIHVSTLLFGVNGFILRVPALVGGALYFAAVRRICIKCLPGPASATAVSAFLSLNPLVLDLMSVARGYGMALGFLTSALALVLKDAEERERAVAWRPWLVLASFALGLCVCSNLAFALIIVGLGVAAILSFGIYPGPAGFWRRFVAPTLQLGLPGAVMAVALLRPLLLTGAAAKQPYMGFTGGRADTVRDLLNALFFRTETAVGAGHEFDWTLNSRMGVMGPVRALVMDYVAGALVVGVAALLAVVLVRCFAQWQGRRPGTSSSEQCAWLTACALTFNWAVYELLHATRGFPYPTDRHSSYLIPFAILAAASVAADHMVARRAIVTVCAALCVVSLVRFDPRYYRTWQYDAGVKNLFEVMERVEQTHPRREVNVGTTGAHGHSLQFYKTAEHADWIARIDQTRYPTRYDDYFLFLPQDVGRADFNGFETLAIDSASGEHLIGRSVPGH